MFGDNGLTVAQRSRSSELNTPTGSAFSPLDNRDSTSTTTARRRASISPGDNNSPGLFGLLDEGGW